jgi:hypothetical protein
MGRPVRENGEEPVADVAGATAWPLRAHPRRHKRQFALDLGFDRVELVAALD